MKKNLRPTTLLCLSADGTWWASRALSWATSPSPSTSPASFWAAYITLIISPEPCTSGSLTLKTCPSNSRSTGPCSAVREHQPPIPKSFTSAPDVQLYYHLLDGQFSHSHLQFPALLMNYGNFLNFSLAWAACLSGTWIPDARLFCSVKMISFYSLVLIASYAMIWTNCLLIICFRKLDFKILRHTNTLH